MHHICHKGTIRKSYPWWGRLWNIEARFNLDNLESEVLGTFEAIAWTEMEHRSIGRVGRN